jgi:hypothetical protein
MRVLLCCSDDPGQSFLRDAVLKAMMAAASVAAHMLRASCFKRWDVPAL